MPTLKIDNREISVPSGTKVIEAAERLGIVIPRFCYHPALGSVGACRVCAVAFKEGPIKGVQMSCMVDAQDGMVVSTTDAEAVDFRCHVIEFLMLSHPHDCPVCDEGGHCLLQDLTVAGGHGMRRYQGRKRTHRNQDLGPLVQHEMNRCIQCYRCVRYYQEFSGYRDLGVMGIGSRVYFGRVSSGVLESPFAGNLIDICPTGVYTDKPSRFTGRRWDFERQPSVCLHCSLGCNLTVSARYRQVVRHEARPNLSVNGYFICDRGRYAYPYASAPDRPRQAMSSGQTIPIDNGLQRAREIIADRVSQSGPASVAVVASSRCSVETLAMVKRICRQARWTGPVMAQTKRQALNAKTAVACLAPDLAVSLADVATAHEVVVIGTDPLNEAPMLALSLRQMQRRGGRVTVMDPRAIDMPFDFDHWAVHPMEIAPTLKTLIEQITDPSAPFSASETVLPVGDLAKRLNSSPRPMIVCGTDVTQPMDIGLAADLADALRPTHKAVGLFYVLSGANTFAAALAGEDGKTFSLDALLDRIEDGSVRSLVVVETDPWRSFPDRPRLQAALKKLEALVVLDYVSSPLQQAADCFIPTQPIYEAGGHWINQEGRVQRALPIMAGGEPIAVTGNGDHPPRVFGSAIPGGQSMAAWHALAALTEKTTTLDQANDVLDTALLYFHKALRLPLSKAADQRIDLEAVVSGQHQVAQAMPSGDPASNDVIVLILVPRIFGTEPLSSMAPALDKIDPPPMAAMHPQTLAALGAESTATLTIDLDGQALTIPVTPEPEMAPGVLAVPCHHQWIWQVVGETSLILNRSQITIENQPSSTQ